MKEVMMHNDDLIVREDTHILGILNGDAIIKKGITLEISGVLNGDVLIGENALLISNGTVNGDVVKKDGTAEFENNGTVNGDILLGERNEYDEDDYDESSSTFVKVSGNHLENTRYSNMSVINGKKIVSNGGIKLTQTNGLTYVNGINLETMEPNEKGVYEV